MSRHYTEEDLTLYYYGEGRRRDEIDAHLGSCADCASLYRNITGALALIAAPDTPARGDQYGLEVWHRIRHQLPTRQPRFFNLAWLAAAAAVAALVIAAFIAGQRSRPVQGPVQAHVAQPLSSDAAKRILLTSVADHLDRSERVLTDIMNTSGAQDISTEQTWAEDLLTTSRLYRQDAIAAGEPSVAAVLDELERNLLEIVHSPSRISNDDLEQIRRRIDAAALLFKVRVLGDELRRRNKTS